ncbi:type VI secretion system ATPase TssH [Roseovarius ramblicola]|uniref:Type VI secretion system ATPase TssH n=1 Tax=Roseovarius ramblicola TaxID=2022336 RepID=A0ABV5I3X3_9RHOB
MTEISLETVAGKLNRLGYDAFMQALRHARGEGNRNVELAHWLHHLLANERSDVVVTLRHFGIDPGRVQADIDKTISGFRRNVTEMPGISSQLTDALDRGWHYATLLFGEAQIRSGHVLVAILRTRDLMRALRDVSPLMATLDADQIVTDARTVWADSDEEDMRPMDGSGLGAAGGAGGGEEGAPGAQTALGRFAIDMTAQAESGKMDPIVGRDEEIRQIIDVLMRRRQNNPILTGEAGVGKTAVVEGFAQALAAGNVPPALRGVRLHALDIGLMQAGASMKGEFEQRLRSVIDEVQQSPTPIILFIDEAHTLIGAGGAAGTGDAANLLKPALARGTLRTVAATTWSEYRQHFEKDPALTRRFQPVNVDEPSIDRACTMLRGILAPMEAHHKVRISDEAVVAAVSLSARYLPARQLPDKAVSLLDTASARVAISQSATPAMVADLRAGIAALETERAAKLAQADLGETNEERLAEIDEALAEQTAALADAEAHYDREKGLVDDILALREKLAAARDGGAAAASEAAEDTGGTGDGAPDEDGQSPDAQDAQDADAPADSADTEALRTSLTAQVGALESGDPDRRMIYAHVDEQAVASVVSDWTGIPVGRMVTDELRAILSLPERLRERVIGQDHGLTQIAKRIETSRARLDNPGKPIGVFMLCGPSGVGKTETALALAEAIYGGEQNVITINMSEFQEAHTVSGLKGAPPGYVGYGEGGRLTEAVRRKPYSVVLLDEVEKAHPDVHELFFQVFDKGLMEDGTGRRIDFKNTVILLTSNVGTEAIMEMAARGETRPEPEALSEALRPHLQRVFPPALLGRIVTIPYFPLSAEVLGGIVRLKLDAIVARMKSAHGARMSYSDAVIDHIVAQCNDPDSGGRMVDNIITNTILPDLSRAVLTRTMEGTEFATVEVGMGEEEFAYQFG